jgi:flagellar assembly factor FliW
MAQIGQASSHGQDRSWGGVEHIWFPRGLVGCPEWQRFRLWRDPDLPLVGILESEDLAGISLLVADPALVCEDYCVDLSDEDATELGIAAADDAWVLVVLVAHEGPAHITANLLGPLVVNRRTGKAKQLVLSDSGYSARHPVAGALDEACRAPDTAASPERYTPATAVPGVRR